MEVGELEAESHPHLCSEFKASLHCETWSVCVGGGLEGKGGGGSKKRGKRGMEGGRKEGRGGRERRMEKRREGGREG